MCYKCTNLEDVIISGSVRSIGESAFRECDDDFDTVVIPDSVVSIGADAFRDCGYLYRVTIGSGVQTICSRAFYNCGTKPYEKDRLDTIIIPDNVKTIEEEAFAECTFVFDIKLGEGMETIGDGAFRHCYGYGKEWDDFRGITTEFWTLETYRDIEIPPLGIPASVKTIGAGAFDGGKYIKELIIYNRPDQISILEDTFRDCESLAKVTLADGLTKIGDRAFSGCKNLTEVVLPNSVKDIGKEAFKDCESAGRVILPNEVNSMGNDAFIGNKSVVQVIIGASFPNTGLPGRFDYYYTSNGKHAGTYSRYSKEDSQWVFYTTVN
jgi:hypothetical protein